MGVLWQYMPHIDAAEAAEMKELTSKLSIRKWDRRSDQTELIYDLTA